MIQRADPATKLSQIKRLTEGMLGDEDDPFLKCHGGESRSLVLFTLQQMQTHVDNLGLQGKLLIRCGQSLLKYYECLRSQHRVVSVDVQSQMMEECVTFCTRFSLVGEMVPKMHNFVHMTFEIAFSGNPQYHSTYEDESENGGDAIVGRSAHPIMFPFTVLQKAIVSEQQ